MIDLFIEAKFLSRLDHPNIVKIRGTAGVPGQSTYAIIIDRFCETLSEKYTHWAKMQKNFKRNGLLGIKKRNQEGALSLLKEIFLGIVDIARAMNFIHGKGIIFRDLKPDNIGFDFRGNAKLFDFGLAKELHASDKIGQDQYNASGMVGSRRYMAPEVSLCKPYGFPTDVYSYGIVTWEILSLRIAFDGYSYEKHAELVVIQGKRPKLKSKLSIEIKQLLVNCWCLNPKNRLTFSKICQCLTEIVNKI